MDYLVRKARNGDTQAFIELIERNKESMKKVALTYLQNEEDRADAISQTILDVYAKIHKLRNTAYFKTWLIRILIHNCIDIYRVNHKYVGVENSLEEYMGCVESNVYKSVEEDIEFMDLLKALPEESRIIFVLYYGEQFTTAEIAKILKMKENTVKSKIHRGKEILRSIL